jgi:hypothetical protein
MWTDLDMWVAAGVLVAAALGMGAWALLHDPGRGRQRCPRCRYDMSGSASLTCPECGHIAASDRALFKRHRHRRLAAAAALLLAAAVCIPPVTMAARYGSWRLAPTELLAWTLPWSGPTARREIANRPLYIRMTPAREAMLLRIASEARNEADPWHRYWGAVLALALVIRGSEQAMPVMLSMLEDPDPLVRSILPDSIVAEYMDRLYHRPKEWVERPWVIPTLLRILQTDQDTHAQMMAATALSLSELAPLHPYADEVIAAMQRDFDPLVRWSLADALIRLAPICPASAAFLDHLASDDDHFIRRKVAGFRDADQGSRPAEPP